MPWDRIIVYFLHYLSIFAVVSGVVSSHLLLRKETSRQEIGRVWVVQVITAAGLGLAIVTGLIQWLVYYSHYTQNGSFHLKLTLVLLSIGLILPPFCFAKKARHGEPGELVATPKAAIMCLRAQLLLYVVVIPLLATLMAHGVGQFG